jgi:hypothetical protein
MLKSSGITKEDVKSNPQEVLDVLKFSSEGGVVAVPAPRDEEVKRMVLEGRSITPPTRAHAHDASSSLILCLANTMQCSSSATTRRSSTRTLSVSAKGDPPFRCVT